MCTRVSDVLSMVLAVSLLGSAGGSQTPQATPSASDPADSPPMYRGYSARTGVFSGQAPSGQPTFLWRHKIGNSPATPGVGDGIVAHGEAGVAAVDQVTAKERLLLSVPSTFSSPLVAGGHVHIGTAEVLVALDPAAGEQSWRFLTGRGAPPDGPPADVFDASPTIADGVLFTASGPWGGLDALNPASGDGRWRLDLDSDTAGSPAVSAGAVLFNPSCPRGASLGRGPLEVRIRSDDHPMWVPFHLLTPESLRVALEANRSAAKDQGDQRQGQHSVASQANR